MKKKTKLNEVKHLQKLAGIKLNENNGSWKDKISDFIMSNITQGDDEDELSELIDTLEAYVAQLKINLADGEDDEDDEDYIVDKEELDENQNDEDNDEDPSAIIEKEYKSSPNEAPYNEVLEIIKSYEDDKILNIFIKKYQNKKTISKKEYLDFNKIHIDLTGDGWIFNLMNWVSIFDPTIYDRTGLI